MDAMKINRPNILISLYRGYGMGDAVQMSAVLRHVRKYRPDWIIDFQAQEGRYCVGRGIVDNVFAYDTPYPSKHYDGELQMILYDNFVGWGDRPNTNVSKCLKDRFDLDWDPDCGRYKIEVSEQADQNAARITPRRCVALHYRGDSAADYKNLSHAMAAEICDVVHEVAHYPLLIDWRNDCPIWQRRRVHALGKYPDKGWGGDAEMNCAVIRRCDAFIGVDSGPAKCASATATPSLVVWTKHHPAVFHDPAPNTTHLIPVNHADLRPVKDCPAAVDFFRAHYNYLVYETDPVPEIRKWLNQVLR